MTITEVIDRLQKAQRKFGDVEVGIIDSRDRELSVRGTRQLRGIEGDFVALVAGSPFGANHR